MACTIRLLIKMRCYLFFVFKFILQPSISLSSINSSNFSSNFSSFNSISNSFISSILNLTILLFSLKFTNSDSTSSSSSFVFIFLIFSSSNPPSSLCVFSSIFKSICHQIVLNLLFCQLFFRDFFLVLTFFICAKNRSK